MQLKESIFFQGVSHLSPEPPFGLLAFGQFPWMGDTGIPQARWILKNSAKIPRNVWWLGVALWIGTTLARWAIIRRNAFRLRSRRKHQAPSLCGSTSTRAVGTNDTGNSMEFRWASTCFSYQAWESKGVWGANLETLWLRNPVCWQGQCSNFWGELFTGYCYSERCLTLQPTLLPQSA